MFAPVETGASISNFLKKNSGKPAAGSVHDEDSAPIGQPDENADLPMVIAKTLDVEKDIVDEAVPVIDAVEKNACAVLIPTKTTEYIFSSPIGPTLLPVKLIVSFDGPGPQC